MKGRKHTESCAGVICFLRLQICRDTAVTIAEHVSKMQTQVTSVKADFDVERHARTRHDQAVDARITAVEDAMRTWPPAQLLKSSRNKFYELEPRQHDTYIYYITPKGPALEVHYP